MTIMKTPECSFVPNIFFKNDVLEIDKAADCDVGALAWQVPSLCFDTWENKLYDRKACLNKAISEIVRLRPDMQTSLVSSIYCVKKPSSQSQLLFAKRYPKRFFIEGRLGCLGDNDWEKYLDDININVVDSDDYFLEWFEKPISECSDRTLKILSELRSSSFICFSKEIVQNNRPVDQCVFSMLKGTSGDKVFNFALEVINSCPDFLVMQHDDFSDYPPISSAIVMGKNSLLSEIYASLQNEKW